MQITAAKRVMKNYVKTGLQVLEQNFNDFRGPNN